MNRAIENELYFVILPQIVVSGATFGRTEQVLTLLPDKNFASAFFAEDVDVYIQVFKNRESYFIGGRVSRFDLEKIAVGDGRFYVRVVQHVE